MKIDEAKNQEEYEEALAEYQKAVFEIGGHHYPKDNYYEYLKAKGPRNRTLKEEAEFFALKLHLQKEDDKDD